MDLQALPGGWVARSAGCGHGAQKPIQWCFCYLNPSILIQFDKYKYNQSPKPITYLIHPSQYFPCSDGIFPVISELEPTQAAALIAQDVADVAL
jgi:hypothetical protein